METLAYDGDAWVTQVFGVNAADYAVFGLAGHNGVDFGVWTGTVLRAPEPGVVTQAYFDPGGYGNTLYVLGDSGYGWRYGHMLAFGVAVGERVQRGSALGPSDNTGNSSGPHLHLGLRPPAPDFGNGFNGYVDPLPRLKALELDEGQAVGGAGMADCSVYEAALAEANAIKQEFEAALRDTKYAAAQRRAAKKAGLVLADWLIRKARGG